MQPKPKLTVPLITNSPVHSVIHIFPFETSICVNVKLFKNKIKQNKNSKREEKILFEFN